MNFYDFNNFFASSRILKTNKKSMKIREGVLSLIDYQRKRKLG